MSDAKLLVEEWVDQLNEASPQIRAFPEAPAVSIDMKPRNPLQSVFGVHPQHRIDQARAQSETNYRTGKWTPEGESHQTLAPEMFGNDRWAKAKNAVAGTFWDPDKADAVKAVKYMLKNGGDSRAAAKLLMRTKIIPEHAEDGSHFLRAVYLGKDDKLVGVYHETVHNMHGWEAPYSRSNTRAFVPLEGQSNDVHYWGGQFGKNYNYPAAPVAQAGDAKSWMHNKYGAQLHGNDD